MKRGFLTLGDVPAEQWPALFDRAAYLNGAELLVDGGLGCMLMDMVPRPGFNAPAVNASNAA